MRSAIVFLCIALAAAQAVPQTIKWPNTLSVCEVLSRLPELDGQLLAVRGVLTITDEGAWLSGRGCDTVLVHHGYRWSTSLWLNGSGKPAKEPSGDIDMDANSLSLFGELLKTRYGNSTEVVVTYLGIVETHKDLDRRVVRRKRDGSLMGLGFGHLAGAPAQLWVRSVSLKDIDWKPK